MQKNLSLQFLQEKINHLKTAIFFNSSSSLCKIPTSIIQVIKVDELGQIWFCLPSANRLIEETDTCFFSELRFFRKGKNFHLKITGKGLIVHNNEEINEINFLDTEFKKLILFRKMTLIKILIQTEDYFEAQPAFKREKKIRLLQSIEIPNFFAAFVQFMKKQVFPEHYHQIV